MPDMSAIKTALPGYFTTSEAAEALGYVDGTCLKNLCMKKQLVAYKAANTWFIPLEQVQALADREIDGRGDRDQLRS